VNIRNLLITFALGSSLALGFIPKAKAAPEDWSTSTRALTGLSMALTVADWGQTRMIARNPQTYRELNPILGPHPSQSRVDAYMIGYLATQYLIAEYAPEPMKTLLLTYVLVVQAKAVGNNRSIGLQIRF
jgi:hypothetical protein